MAVTKQVQEVTFGGDASNNPSGYSWTDYSNYPDLDLNLHYQRFNVIALHEELQVPLQVTGLVQVNAQGQPMLNATDLVYLPCPPFCDK